MSRLTPRRAQLDHPAARVRESQYGRHISGPSENERAPRSPAPTVRSRGEDTAEFAQRLYAANRATPPSRPGGLIRGLMICALIEIAFSFFAVAVYFVVGSDPMRALVPAALAAFFVGAAYVVTVDS